MDVAENKKLWINNFYSHQCQQQRKYQKQAESGSLDCKIKNKAF